MILWCAPVEKNVPENWISLLKDACKKSGLVRCVSIRRHVHAAAGTRQQKRESITQFSLDSDRSVLARAYVNSRDHYNYMARDLLVFYICVSLSAQRDCYESNSLSLLFYNLGWLYEPFFRAAAQKFLFFFFSFSLDEKFCACEECILIQVYEWL